MINKKFKILLTGCAGFIGSHIADFLLARPEVELVVGVDNMSYSADEANLCFALDNGNFRLEKADIADMDCMEDLFSKYCFDLVINCAAHTHVDRSILDNPFEFERSNVLGTLSLLECAKKFPLQKFVQISTDEVYGSVKEAVDEQALLSPSNLYSATKAAADFMVISYYKTYKLPLCITRSVNNYGPRQYPEKVIPLFVTNALENKQLPIYGDGTNIRQWIHVTDHVRALWTVSVNGTAGQIYNIGSDCEFDNTYLAEMILSLLDKSKSLITYVKDRLGHDLRYALKYDKIRNLGWQCSLDFENGLKQTVEWYIKHPERWRKAKQAAKTVIFFKKCYQDI